MLPLDYTAERFRFFAEKVYASRTALYTNLAVRVAEDSDVLRVAMIDQSKAALPNLFFGAVHFLLLNGLHHQLAAFYPSITHSPRHYDYVYAYFRSFALEHAEEIRKVMTTHSVQTNEVGRCAQLLPAFELVALESKRLPLNMIEIGSSAGLNLLWDKYRYQYGESARSGDPDSPVVLKCRLEGEILPLIPRQMPRVASRVGLDLSPIDLNDGESVQWLRALVWPDNLERARLLEQAIRLVRQAPPRIITGDALELLPKLIQNTPEKEPSCIYHSFTLVFSQKEPREKLHKLLAKASKRRDLFLVSLEFDPEMGAAFLALAKFTRGEETEQILAECQSHGEWMKWMYRQS